MKSRLAIGSWCFYDFANSSFATIILTVGYSIFFKETICGGGGRGDFLWGLSLALAYAWVAILAPFLGAVSDERGSRKNFLIFLTLLAIVSTFSLSFLGPGMILAGMVLFNLGFFGFAVGNVFYNTFLLDIAGKERLGRISGLGWALGYIGGLASLGMCYPWISTGRFKTAFGLTALFFLVFSLPAFIFLKSQARTAAESLLQSLKKGLHRLNATRREIAQHRELCKFLVAFFFFNDALSTVITFSSIYAHDTFQMDMREVSLLFVSLQITAFMGAFISGPIVDRVGSKKTILVILGVWVWVIIASAGAQTKTQFWVVAWVAGLGLGSLQSAARTFVALMVPPSRAGEFFGFFAVFAKLSSILGPFLFGLASYTFASQRKAILTLLFFFILGAVLMMRVREEEKT